MKPRLRSHGLRVSILFALVAALFGFRAATPVTPLPGALLASFEKAVAAVEDQIRALEQAPPRSTHDVIALLAHLDGEITVACDAATEALDRVLETAPPLPPFQRAVVRACIDRHLWDARRELARTTDPQVRAEYDALCERLHQVRDHVG